MNLLNPIKIGVNISINVLTNLYGISSDVYFPIKSDSLQYGYFDDNIEYPSEPNWSGKLLIPSIFKEIQASFSGAFDNLTPDEKILYLPNTIEFPRYSKIIIWLQDQAVEYRINDIQEYRDDEGQIYRKYILVPITNEDIDNEKVEELIENNIENFDENPLTQNIDTEKDYSIVEESPIEINKPGFDYDPL